jgi:hypothetical protein
MSNYKRRGDPANFLATELKLNPSLRQLSDLSTLIQHNKNPRLNELTSADLKRSEKYLPDRETGGVKDKLFGVTAKSLSKGMRVPLSQTIEKLSTIEFNSPTKASTTKGSGATPTKLGMSETEINDAPVMLNYSSSLAVPPPSFGHRPGSASRTFNPVTMSSKPVKGWGKSGGSKKKKKGTSGILSVSVLKTLLTVDDDNMLGTRKTRQLAAQQSLLETSNNNDKSSYAFADDESYSTLGSLEKGSPAANTGNNYAPNNTFESATSPANRGPQQTSTNSASNYFDKTYVVPEKVTKLPWDTSFVQVKADIRDSRPHMMLTRDDRDGTTTKDRIERFRKLAAGVTTSVTGGDDRESLGRVSEWREEMDRKFAKVNKTGVKISPRSQAINRDVMSMLREEKARQRKLDDKVKDWEAEVARERTENIGKRRKGRGRVDDHGGLPSEW